MTISGRLFTESAADRGRIEIELARGGAIGSGSKATAVFGSAWFGVFSAVMTLMILFLSEIVPKTLGVSQAQRFAPFVALFVNFLGPIAYLTVGRQR